MGEKPTEVDAEGFVLLAPGHWRMSTMQERVVWAIWRLRHPTHAEHAEKLRRLMRSGFVPRGNLR